MDLKTIYREWNKSFNKMMASYNNCVQLLVNLSDMIRAEFNQKDFENKLKEKIVKKCRKLFEDNEFNTKGMLDTYLTSLHVEFILNNDLTYVIKADEGNFDRSRHKDTDYTTATGIHATYSITYGKIMDMIDAGRRNFKIVAQRSRLVVDKETGKRYRWIVYRAIRRYTVNIKPKKQSGRGRPYKTKQKSVYKYVKERNYKKYDPTKDDNYRRLIPESRWEINVRGVRWSYFGLKLYDFIEKCLEDSSIQIDILGKNVDSFINDYIANIIKQPFAEMKRDINDCLNKTKVLIIERNR